MARHDDDDEFIRKKSSAEVHRILVETNGHHALLETTRRDWFRHLKNYDFDVEDKECSGALKSLKIKNWRYYFMKFHVRPKLNLQNHQELITQQFENIWKHYEWLKSKDIGCCTSWSWEILNSIMSCVNSCFSGKKRNILHCIMTGNEKWIHYNNPMHRRSCHNKWIAMDNTLSDMFLINFWK